ncbi:MAG: SGNH/GDSL hydrolase family protein [Burkholderiaceae bacterium]|nr:SGNH/GDSL hydrolase family protein [Burkholderiaceae bacterium]
MRHAALAICLLSTTMADAAQSHPEHWVAAWGTAQMVPEGDNALPGQHWRNASLRQVARLSLGGKRVRVRLSNAFGVAPLQVDAASIALAPKLGSADVDGATLRALSFNGRSQVMIPAGAEFYSDPVDLAVGAGGDVAISLHFSAEPARQTGHPGSRSNSYLLPGNRVADAAWPQAQSVPRWYVLSDVEVLADAASRAMVAIGDSITDGYGVVNDSNTRWTDVLATRLRAANLPVGVVNAGIGGGRLLRDGLGPNLSARFLRDVIGRAGVTHALVLIGVNDMGGQHRNSPDTPADRQRLLADMQAAYRQLADQAHAHGVCLLGATITPYAGSGYYHPEAENEADRVALNDWMRSSGVFDHVVDFDAALRDPARPAHLDKAYDSGDGLHPSAAGYRALADAVPLQVLRQTCGSRP